MHVSSSHTEMEINDLGIGYDKGACPRDLALEDGYVSRSNGCSQSHRHASSPSNSSKHTKSVPVQRREISNSTTGVASLEVHKDPAAPEHERQSEKSNVAYMLLRA